MTAFHLLRCMVDLGNDHSTVVARDRFRPIVFPELPILQFLHGEDAVTDIAVVGQWETTNDEVLARINQIYDPEIVQKVFPGARPRLPPSDASIPLCTRPVYKPRPVGPDSPDPKLKPLDQFTVPADAPLSPPVEPETEPTPDEIAAHAQDDDVDMGLAMPNPADLPKILDRSPRGTSKVRTPTHL